MPLLILIKRRHGRKIWPVNGVVPVGHFASYCAFVGCCHLCLLYACCTLVVRLLCNCCALLYGCCRVTSRQQDFFQVLFPNLNPPCRTFRPGVDNLRPVGQLLPEKRIFETHEEIESA